MDNLKLKEDLKELRIEKSLYKANGLSYYLVLLSIVLNGVFLIRTLNVIDKTYSVGLIILFNIFISLLLFLGAVRLKTYAKNWTYITTVVGVVQVIRAIFFIPENATGTAYLTLVLLLLISAALLIGSAVYAYQKIILQESYKAKLTDAEARR